MKSSEFATTKEKPVKVITNDGNENYVLNGQLHREDGPAVIRPDGTREWWVHGKKVK
jgi:hypothetical protein